MQFRDPYLNLATSYQKTSEKPSVLFALPFVVTGGTDTVLLGAAECLTANGLDLVVVTTLPTNKTFGDNTTAYEAITKQVYHLYKFLDEETAWRDFLFYLIETRRIGVLLLAGSSHVYSLLPEIRQRLPRLRVVDHLFDESGHIENNRKYADFIDAHIVVNDVIKGVLINQFSEAEGKIHVIKPGVDVETRFNPDNIEEDRPMPAAANSDYRELFLNLLGNL